MTGSDDNSDDLVTLAERVRVLDAAMTSLLEVVRDIVTEGEGSLNPGLMALAKVALKRGEDAQEGE